MSSIQVSSLVVAAVLVFWALGAYNRLIALRNAIGAAYAQLDAPLRRRHSLLASLLTALHPEATAELSNERGALDTAAAASQQVLAAADAARAGPSVAAPVDSLAMAEGVMVGALARLMSLVEQHRELAARGDVAPLLAELRAIEPKLAFARQLFNDAAAAYNQAARQFPTRLLVRLFGFGTAGRL